MYKISEDFEASSFSDSEEENEIEKKDETVEELKENEKIEETEEEKEIIENGVESESIELEPTSEEASEKVVEVVNEIEVENEIPVTASEVKEETIEVLPLQTTLETGISGIISQNRFRTESEKRECEDWTNSPKPSVSF